MLNPVSLQDSEQRVVPNRSSGSSNEHGSDADSREQPSAARWRDQVSAAVQSTLVADGEGARAAAFSSGGGGKDDSDDRLLRSLLRSLRRRHSDPDADRPASRPAEGGADEDDSDVTVPAGLFRGLVRVVRGLLGSTLRERERGTRGTEQEERLMRELSQ